MTDVTNTIRRQISTVEDLRTVISTTKSIASVNVHKYQPMMKAIEPYGTTIEMGIQAVVRNRPNLNVKQRDANGQTILIVFGTDQGLVGPFNLRVAAYISENNNHLGVQPAIIAVGKRLASHLQAQEHNVPFVASVPNTVEMMISTVCDLLVRLDTVRQQTGGERVDLVYNHPGQGTAYSTRHIGLLPLDLQWLDSMRQREWTSKTLPTARADLNTLLTELTQQYAFVTLYRVLVYSLISENASRLAAMEKAENNIDERLADLSGRYNVIRQEAITEELFDAIAGIELLEELVN